MKVTLFAVSAFFLIGFLACTKDIGPNPDLLPKPLAACDSVTYTDSIQPIISANCATPGCHDIGSLNGDFTTYVGVKAKVDNGSFQARVIDGTPSPMPPTGLLPAQEINKLKCWLAAGAPNN